VSSGGRLNVAAALAAAGGGVTPPPPPPPTPTPTGPVTGVTLTGTPISPVAVNTPVTLTAQASGGTAEYLFTVRRSSWWGSGTTTLQSYSPSATATWRPTSTGTYLITVYARRTGSTVNYEVYRSLSYTVR
jgi:hypothetical protein